MIRDGDTATAGYSPGNEYVWHSAGNDWRQASLVTAGVDVGSTTSQALVLADRRIFGYSSVPLGADAPDSAARALEALLRDTGMTLDSIHLAVSTGCGEANRAIISRTVSEISCHARGAAYAIGPPVKTVLAMGGRDCTAVSCRGTGAVASFLANACHPAVCRENLCNACGAAQGQAIDAVAEALDVRIEDVGDMSLGVDDEAIARRLSLPHDDREFMEDEMLDEIGDEILADGGTFPLGGALGVVCAVLARNQTHGLLRNGWSPAEILAAYCATLAHQAAELVRRLGLTPELAVTGGVARNVGVVRRLEEELGVRPTPVNPDPQIAGALGAALYAADFSLDRRDSG